MSQCLTLRPFREEGKFPLPVPAPYSSLPPSSDPASLPLRSLSVSPFRPLPLSLSHSVSLTLQPPVQLQPPLHPPSWPPQIEGTIEETSLQMFASSGDPMLP
ncbi:hypothetical protein Fmac_001659 [Flemingia macrophylla]|uniref:Uncharacterized protein n=1 Tax=Flemingia macrophylla TaxID=520843 RepID=A0ABD1NHS4_9FABA